MLRTRRRFLAGAAAGAAALPAAVHPAASGACGRISLNGEWKFRPGGTATWSTVRVPHTWQITPGLEEYYGEALYERTFDAPQAWSDSTLRLEFEAVFHSAWITVNGQQVGEHVGKGYTAFVVDITKAVRFGALNTIAVKVDNAFNEKMLPRGRSSDWTHDGGIYRPVSLLVTPKVYVERVEVDADPHSVEAAVILLNTGGAPHKGLLSWRIVEEDTGLVAQNGEVPADAAAGASVTLRLSATIAKPRLWHFDHPHLYRLETDLESGHNYSTVFGIRRIEVKEDGFYLNGERMRLMGVERMAGSNPEFGMAEPASWLTHDHDDMKELNCVFTRVHWQQDRRVLDYCDRHGMLIQVEVPTWGGKTFSGMNDQPSDEIMQNGLEQLREMVARDRNHPSVISWGLCNEIGGQNAPAYQFARRMYEEAKLLDPRRLRSYASNSLQETPEKDVSALMDFIEWNEYYESWFGGTVDSMRANLEEIHRAFPGKMVVISEYGYCACTEDRPEGDAKRIEILRAHDRIFRDYPWVGGLIFFCYNDYRTHIGDKGKGVMRQRVHGVVDLYGSRKPSFQALREESSPIEVLSAIGKIGQLSVRIRTRNTVPSYTLRGYLLRAVVHGFGDVPFERIETKIPDLQPGREMTIVVRFEEKHPAVVKLDVMRPTGFSAAAATWKP
jgi:beta-glucuronidase